MTPSVCLVRPFALAMVLLALTGAAAAVPPPVDWHSPRLSKASGVFVYTDALSHIRMNVPIGWHVRAETLNGQRQLRVIPAKADQRERAAIDVVVLVRPFARGETMARLAQRYRQTQGDREAAREWRYNPKQGHLLVEFREGGYVSGQLWIMRQNLYLFQRLDKNHILSARCTANASEFKTYRRSLETICYSVERIG